MILRSGLRLVGAGVVVGGAGALALSRTLSSLLFGVGAADVTTYVAVTVLLAAVALLASYLPARRATRFDPAVAFRSE